MESLRTTLLREIDTFIAGWRSVGQHPGGGAESGCLPGGARLYSESRFGLEAANDAHLVRQLRQGRSIGIDKVDLIRRYMAEYAPPNSERVA